MPVSKKRVKRKNKLKNKPTKRGLLRTQLRDIMAGVFGVKDKFNVESKLIIDRYENERKTILSLDDGAIKTESLNLLDEFLNRQKDNNTIIDSSIDQTVFKMDEVATAAKDIASDKDVDWQNIADDIDEHVSVLNDAQLKVNDEFVKWWSVSIENLATYAEKATVLIEKYNEHKNNMDVLPENVGDVVEEDDSNE